MAAIEAPASHHGIARPPTKYSTRLFEPRRASHIPSHSVPPRYPATTSHSNKLTRGPPPAPGAPPAPGGGEKGPDRRGAGGGGGEPPGARGRKLDVPLPRLHVA